MTRKQAVTVRLPVASRAPTNSTLACSQTGLVNSGANSTINGNNAAGNMGIGKTSLGRKFSRSLCGLPLLFQRPKLDKVELRGWLITYAARRAGRSSQLRSLSKLPGAHRSVA